MSLVFKICHRADWERPEHTFSYSGSPKDREDGFLHFSTAEQLAGTLAKYYAEADDLVLVAVDPHGLGAALKYEPSRDGMMFPHLYAPLTYDCVKWLKDLRRDDQGNFILPDEINV